jgi:arylformamidase
MTDGKHPFPHRPIAHGLARSRLAAEYDVEATVPDLPGYMRRFIERSDETRRLFQGRARLDVAYGALPAQKLDLYLPEGGRPAPVVVFFHGGAWKGSNKECRAFPAQVVCPLGGVWISAEYPLAPEHTLETQAASAEQALGWVVENAAGFGGDARRILVMGHSAGGHLATIGLFRLLAQRPELAPRFELLTLSAVFDLEPMMFTKVNEWLHLDLARVMQHSPLWNIPVQAPPLHAMAGGGEPGVFVQQSLDMVAACAGRGVPSRFTALPGRNHFSVLEDFELAESPLQAALRGFLAA